MGGSSTGDRLLAVLAHVSFFFLPIILPLILVLVGSTDGFVRHHARQALVFHLFLFAGGIVSAILSLIFIGIILAWALGIFGLVVTIIAIVRAAGGEYYNYPITGSWFQ